MVTTRRAVLAGGSLLTSAAFVRNIPIAAAQPVEAGPAPEAAAGPLAAAVEGYIFGYPLVTHALDLVYAAWFVLLYTILFWQIFSTRDPALRMQFLWSFLLCWIFLGTICATAFSSVVTRRLSSRTT